MKQEPTGAAHAAGGIPALQGREDVKRSPNPHPLTLG